MNAHLYCIKLKIFLTINHELINAAEAKSATEDTASEARADEGNLQITPKHQVLKGLNVIQYEKGPRFLKSYLPACKLPKTRYKNDVFMLEGWRQIGDAMSVGLKPLVIYFSRSRMLLNMKQFLDIEEDEELVNFLSEIPVIKTPYPTFKLWSHLVTPPGIMGE